MQCLSPVTFRRSDGIQTFPCGKCLACLSNRRRDWVFRLKSEYKFSTSALFLTLTYDDEYYPPDGVNKEDIQLFLKRLRKFIEPAKIRYFLVSEYGSQTFRAHYHMLLFNFPLDLNYEDIITNSWQKGFVHFGSVTGRSISYCAKYCLSIGAEPVGKNPVFMLCSRKPGIGNSYLDSSSLCRYHRHGANDVAVSNGSKTVLPRYYKDKLFNRFQKEIIKKRNYERILENDIEYHTQYNQYDAEQIERGEPSYQTQLKADYVRKTEIIINKSNKL